MWRKFLKYFALRTAVAHPYSEIDPKIKTLVNVMNATGCIQTIASCQGHGASGKPPYLYFKCSERTASTIERRLRSVAINRTNGSGFGWTIEAMFNQELELCYLLYSPKLHQSSKSIFFIIHYFSNRKKLEAEFSSLACEIKNSVLPDIGDHYKPSITEQSGQQNKCEQLAE